MECSFLFFFTSAKVQCSAKNMNKSLNANRDILYNALAYTLCVSHNLCAAYTLQIKPRILLMRTKLTYQQIGSLSSFHAVNEYNLSHFLILQLESGGMRRENPETNSAAIHKVSK